MQIIKDLTDAETLLPDEIDDSDFGRPSKWAAKGILSRVYLTNKKYADAKTKLTEIISSKKYRLLDDYKQRMADVHLMMAEVLNETNGAMEDVLGNLNAVRERGGLNKYLATDFSTKGEILDAILNERRIELSFEDLRWFDLLRTGKAIEVMNKKNTGGNNPDAASAHPYTSIDQSHLLYPIPQAQVDASGGVLTQN